MAEDYSYPVLVEFEKTNSLRLKNKLIKYFQSKKSNGGDCEVEYEPGSTTALLRFRRKEDQKNVLTKQEHQINLDERVLKMTVRLPSGQRDLSDKSRKKFSHTGTNKWSTVEEHNPMDEGQREAMGNDGDSADEELCSTSTVLGNVSESVTQEFLEMLVENILRDISPVNTAKNYILELIPDISSAVVKFEKGTVNSEFIERCPKNRMFTKKGFSIRPLETTNRVVAAGFSDCSEDMLHLYFESKGGDVEDVKLNEAEKSAVITFKDCKAIKKIMSMKHNIRKQEVKVYPFYKSLGVALYGKDKTSPKLPSVISKPANKPVLGYVTEKKAALESVRHDLEKHFFNIPQEHSAVSPSLLKQKVNQAWTKNWTTPEEHYPVGKGQREAIGKDGDSADEEQWSTSAVIENIPESITQEFLEMIVENILRDQSSPTASQNYILELIPDISSAVVTFQGGKVNREFIDRCPKNRMFTKKGFSIRPLETTRRVVVEGVLNFSEDMLHLYFESKGGDIEDVKLNETQQSAVITFKDHQDVKKVMSMKHSIKKQEVKVYPFYKSLGVALYGKDKPSPKLPASISEPIDTAMLGYLAENKAALETVRCDLERHFCIITLDKSTVRLSALPLLLKQKEAKVIIQEWANSVRSAFSQSVSKFKSIKFSLESEVWEESVQKIKEKLQKEDVVVVPDKSSGILYMVGLVNEVNTLEKPVSEVLSRIGEKVRREKLSKTQEINLPPSIFLFLSQDGIQDKLLQMYPELKLSYDQKKKGLKVTGLVEEIINANQEINNAMFALKRQNLELDQFLLDMLKEEQQEEATDVLLTAFGLKAALEISPQRVQLLAVSDKDLMSAQDHLSQILKSEYIKVEDNDVLKKPEWQQLVHQLEKANSVSGMRTQIKVHHQQVVVSGQMDNVDKVSSEIDDFLTQNVHVEEFVAVEANVVIEYLKGQAPWLKQLEGGVDVSFGKEEIILSGCRNAVQSCISIVKDSLSSMFFESLKVTKPGVKKLFLDKEYIYVNLIKTETGCLVQLIDDSNKDYKDVATIQVQKHIFKIQTSNGTEIVVSKADICSYSVDAVVKPSTDDLKHNGGLALAISKAAGPQLQAECDTIINLKGKLTPGDCVVTNAGGSLRCKKVIHAVGPSFDPNKPKKAEAQLRRTVKESLELAQKRGCVSVALPAISRNLGFSLNLCLNTIVTTVKEYCDERHDDLTLKVIHLVDNDDSVAIGMVAFVKQEFGNHGASVAPPKPLPKVNPKPPLIKLALPDPSLCRAQTKEGLEIVLKKGNIEAAKTDVILDPVPGDLLLNKWAISNAISNAAGPKLQQLVHSQKTSGAAGDVIVTDSCNLKSKQVFHAIAPNWDDGKGASEKLLSGIFKDCLDLAEKTGLTSISFPAVGTGKLGFPKDLVASLMLDKILEFSSQRQSKNLKKVVVILYPGNTDIIKVFTDEFKKKFPSATAPSAAKGSLPANSSQSTGKFCKVVSSSGMHETKLGKVTVQVVTGDITKETTEVIVNSSNDNFTLKSGVSKAILDAAGPAIVEECAKLGSQTHSGMIMTAPGSLKCSKILHVVGKTNPSDIHQATKEALQLCVKNSHTSVSFPAIGTGQGNVAAKAVADSMLDAVIDVMSQKTSSSLTLIRIVIFQQNMLKDFCSSMQEREVPDPTDKAGFLQNVGQKIKAIFIPESPEKKQEQKVFDFETIEVEPTLFHICGDSQTSIDAAKKKINDLISDQQGSMEITDNDILNLSSADCQRIVDIQKSMGVSIKHHINNGQASIVIEGLNKDVLQASKEADMMLRKVRGEQELKKKYDLAATVAEWQYQRQGLQYQSVDQVTNYELEHALERGITSLTVTIQGSNYTVQMPKGPATDSQGNTLQIRRIDKLKADDVPEFWEPMPAGQTCHSVPIQATSPEYAEVLNLFQATCKRAITKVFTDVFKKKFPTATASASSAQANTSQSTGKFSKVVSSSGMHETKLGNVTVQVATGDITKETTDVIVNSSNDNFTLKTGVSKAILDAAGVAVVEECQYLGSQPHSGIIMTVPGNLKCSKILHMVGKTNPSEIHQAVKEALQLCVKNSYTSVSFPAIGTGQGKVGAKTVADSMLDAVIDVMSQNTSSSLTLIRIIIFQQNMLKDFCSSMQERENSGSKDQGFWTNVGQKIISFFTSGGPEQNQQDEMFDFETIEVEPTFFHICGDSQTSIDAAKNKINDLISDQQDIMEITDNAILNLSFEDCQRIIDIQKSMGVSIKHHTNNGQPSIVIEGLSRDVLRANKDIDILLRKVRGEQELKKKYELAATVAEWQYQRQGLQYQSVDQVTNYELEHALERGITSLTVTIQGSNYTVQMPKGPATDSQGNTLQIRRIDKLKADDVPEFWEPMPAGQTCHSVPIQATSPEYAEVLNLFQATCKRAITKIERIQNPAMWKSLQIRKHDMEVRNNHQNNEKRLFHGTCETTVPIINAQGFNRSYAGKNATCYGKGSYFAVNASYSSNDTYSKPNQNGEKFMYLCRVLTGDYTLAQQDMIAPPPKGGSDVYLYDSVVDNLTKPNMFVVFHDSHAYPEYLITFK